VILQLLFSHLKKSKFYGKNISNVFTFVVVFEKRQFKNRKTDFLNIIYDIVIINFDI
jgi:hypothetical protein